MTDLAGEARIDRLEVLATNGTLHGEMLARLRAQAAPGSESPPAS